MSSEAASLTGVAALANGNLATPDLTSGATATAAIVASGVKIDGSDRLIGLDPILGRSPLYRHLAHLSASGVTDITVLITDGLSATERDQVSRDVVLAAQELGVNDIPLMTAEAFAAIAPPDREVILVADNTILDPRIYRLAVDTAGRYSLHRFAPPTGGVSESGDEAIGVYRVRCDEVAEKSTPRFLDCPDSNLETGGEIILGIDTIPEYLPSMRRHLPAYAVKIENRRDQRKAARLIMNSAQKGVLDFPARYFHPVPENVLASFFSGTRVTPNIITISTGVIGFIATWLFATGSFIAAIALAMLVNILDGVDGKLARVRLQSSKFGDRLDHLLDVTYEFSWYLAFGWGLRAATGNASTWLAGMGLIGVMLLCRALSGIYLWLAGRQIHDHRAFDRAFRLIAGRRNIYLFIWLAAWALGSLSLGLLTSFWWGVATAAVYLIRVLMAAVPDSAEASSLT